MHVMSAERRFRARPLDAGSPRTPDSGEAFAPTPGRVCLFKLRDEVVEPIHPQGGVRLASWPEVLLHPEMYLNNPGSEPSATAGREGLWLREDSEAEYVAVERLCLALAIGGHGKLHVVKGCDADAHAMNPSTRRAGDCLRERNVLR